MVLFGRSGRFAPAVEEIIVGNIKDLPGRTVR
jgi:hypothetical protein